jgi:two-component system phosphate regulon sensor histidine kinase PhoR
MVAVSIGMVSLFSFSIFQSYYLKSVVSDVFSNAMLVKDIVERAIAGSGRRIDQNEVVSLSQNIGKDIVVIENGIVIASSESPENVGKRDRFYFRFAPGREHTVRVSSVREMWSSGKIFAVVRASFPEGNSGIIAVSTPFLPVKKMVSKIILTVFLGSILGGMAALFLLKKFSSAIVKSIKDMIDVARAISSGNFSRSIKIESDDELGQLGETLNTMSGKLWETLNELDDRTTKMEAILSSMVDGVVAVDTGGRIMLFNPAAEKIFETSEKEALGRHLIEVVRNYELNEIVSEALVSGETSFKELVLLPSERILRVHVSPFKDKSGRILGIVAVIRDISELRKLEKMRSDFVANVSHELRTPLTSIKGFIETLLDGAYRDPNLSRRFLKIIDFEAGRLHRLISDLLDLSQLETNQMRLRMEDVDIAGAVDEVMVIFNERINEKHLEFSTRFQENLPKVKADPDWLRQVFINLIDNAIKYTPSGGKVWIEAEEKGEFVEVKVCDTGIGIPEEDLPRVFERFYRVDKARSRQQGGTGLGLSIVKHIIKSQGGDIRVESKKNEGSKFIFLLKKSA